MFDEAADKALQAMKKRAEELNIKGVALVSFAPGDIVKIESVASDSSTLEFSDVLAFSGEAGSVTKPSAAKVTAEVVGQDRGGPDGLGHGDEIAGGSDVDAGGEGQMLRDGGQAGDHTHRIGP